MNRSTGFTDQLDRMVQSGLIRFVEGQTREPWQYEFVPPGQVRAARDEAARAASLDEQRARSVAALTKHGKRGVRASDFRAPTIDGGPENRHFARAMAHVRRTLDGGKVKSERAAA
jgi:hypothetical protein